MTFLEQYRALAEPGVPPQEVAKRQFAMIQEWVVKHPDEMFGDLRANQPIFVTPVATVVTRYRDVLEVINLDDIFSVKPYGIAMMRNNGGPNFILGMDDGPEFEHDLSVLKLAVRRDDLPRIKEIVARRTKELIDKAQAQGQGQIDLTDGFGRLVPTLMVTDYFGVPGPNSTVLMNWVRAVFTDIFLNFTSDPKVSEVGMKAGVEFRAYVDALVAEIKAARAKGAPEQDDVIGRLITMQKAPKASFTDDRVRDNIIGCVCGVLENTNTAISNIMNFLFDHPDVMKGAVAAAAAGDTALVRKYVLESMRFHTPAGLMVRVAVKPHTLAPGTPHETTIKPGTVVFAANGSAMMDETVVDDPHTFKLDRPSHHYLHFGWGIHQCLGKYISEVQVTEIIKGLLQLKGLRRADGELGQLKYHGPFPESFSVAFDSQAVSV
jgi:cytochrome P450